MTMDGLRAFIREYQARRVNEYPRAYAAELAADHAHNAVRVAMPGFHWTEITPPFWYEVYKLLRKYRGRAWQRSRQTLLDARTARAAN